MKPAVEWVSRPSRPSELLPSSRAARSSGSVLTSYVEPEHELAGVQDERLVALRLHQPGSARAGRRRGRCGGTGGSRTPGRTGRAGRRRSPAGPWSGRRGRARPGPRRSRPGCRGLRAARGEPTRSWRAGAASRVLLRAERLPGCPAGVAQLVERDLPKVDVASSSLVIRSSSRAPSATLCPSSMSRVRISSSARAAAG